MSTVSTDIIIIGAGLYGLYAALKCAKKGKSVAIIEYDEQPFKRATYINQARVHMGYHYPRSLSTAVKSAGYYERFHEDYGFCIHDTFDQIYATSKQFSWTNALEFKKFCDAAGIFCEQIDTGRYFKDGYCDGAFRTREDTYDAILLKEYFLKEIGHCSNVWLNCNARIRSIVKKEDVYEIILANDDIYVSDFVLNATYASTNQILSLITDETGSLGVSKTDIFPIKYELCEIILCETSDALKDVGITVMDGPFFSIMPFGKTGYHSLTSVTFTPHETSYDQKPKFDCQLNSGGFCSQDMLGNCNDCPAKPQSSWPYMSSLAKKYMKDEYGFEYKRSLFSMKPILKTTEVDDSRPTVIKTFSTSPTFVSVLSGKINTVYDLDDILDKR